MVDTYEFLFNSDLLKEPGNLHHYVGLFSDSLSANILLEAKLGTDEFRNVCCDRPKCFGHQLNLGALEATEFLDHDAMVTFGQLTAKSHIVDGLLAKCNRIGVDTYSGAPPGRFNI